MTRQPDEEIFHWHGALAIDEQARPAIEELAGLEGMSFEEVLKELQRRRYKHSQEDWLARIGEEPHEKMPYHSGGISITTDVRLPTGKVLSLITYTGVATEVKLKHR